MELQLGTALEKLRASKRIVCLRASELAARDCVSEITTKYDETATNPYQLQTDVRGTRAYTVRLQFTKNGHFRASHCTCPAFASYSGACKHVIATLIVAESKQAMTGFDWPIIVQPAQKVASKITVLDGSVQLIPYFIMSPRSAVLEFRIVGAREYVVKSIPDFLRAVRLERNIRYGQQLEFVHRLAAFHEDSQRLIERFLALDERRLATVLNGRQVITSLKTLVVIAKMCREVRIRTREQGEQTYQYVPERPKFSLDFNVIKGISTLEWRKPTVGSVYGDETANVLFWNQQLYLFKETEEQLAGVLAELTNREATYEIYNFNRFYDHELPIIADYVRDLSGWFDLAVNEEPLRARVRISLDKNDDMSANIIYELGEQLFLSNDYQGRTEMFADKIAAFGLEKKLHEAGFDHFLKLRDEELAYEFIHELLPQLANEYHVEISDDFANWKLPSAASSFTFGIRLESDLLKIDVDQLQFSLSDYRAIAKKYQLKKKYHRLQSGAFINLQTPELQDAFELIAELDLSDEELVKGVATRTKAEAFWLQDRLRQQTLQIQTNQAFQRLANDVSHEVGEYQFPQIQATLRSYQETGVRWLSVLGQYQMGAILADDMGLGKTLQVITLLLGLKERGENSAPHLIVTPKTLLYNWQAECRKFASTLNVLVISGTMSERKALIATMNDYDVVITSYDALRRDSVAYEAYEFHYAVLDEAHIIKNALTQGAKSVKKLRTQQRVALTGTPIENSLADLWSLFDFILPGFLGSYPEFRKRYEQPITKFGDTDKQKRLQKLTAPFILRRLKTEVLTELPEKIETTMYCTLERDQRKLYEQTLVQANRELQAEIDAYGEQKARTLMWTLLLRLRQLCCHPALYLENYQAESAKLQLCLELVEESISGHHQVLIFSQFTSMLDVIAESLEQRGITYFMLNGKTSASERLALVERFNRGEVPIFLISLKAGGTGLNLTGADVVIHYDPWWNLSAQNQATDRAYRMGQTKTVQVYQLLAKDTIEERIATLQQRKHALAEALVQTGETPLSTSDIKNLVFENAFQK